MDGIEKGKFNQTVWVASVEQIKIGIKQKDVAFNIIREFQFMSLSRRHKEHAGRFNFILIPIDYMKTRTVMKVENFKEVVAVRIFYTEMSVRVEYFNLKLLTFSLRLAEVLQAVNRELFAGLLHKKVLSYCYESTNN